MPYALQTDLELAAGGAERFRQLADFNGDGIADVDVIARAQSAADGFIDPYLQNKMTTPLVAPWPEISTLAAEQAVYKIKGWRGLSEITQADTDGHKERIETMKLYQSGVKRPPDPQPAQSSASRAAWIDSDPDASPFSRAGLKRGGL